MRLKLTHRNHQIAIVCHPWDNVALRSNNSIVIIAYQLARHLPGDSNVIVYGRRGPGQKSFESDGDNIKFKRFKVLLKPQAIIETFLGVLACYLNIKIKYMFSYLYHIFYITRVAFSVKFSKCDIILVYNFLQFASIIKLLNPRAKICLNMQCEWLTQFATTSSERQLRKIDLVIGCSNYITEKIKTRFPTMAARCHTVYNGSDTDRFCPAPVSPLASDESKRLLYVGRLSPEKGVHVLIRAFKILAERRPGLRLDLVGPEHAPHYIYLSPDPQDKPTSSLREFFGSGLFDMVRRQFVLGARGYLADLASEAAGDKRITVHGAVLQAKTIDFYHRATALVFPSVWNEPFGMPTAEAMACGLPVVSTYSGGIPEIVEHGRTGLLVPRGDANELAAAIAKVLDDPARARTMGEAGRQRAVAHFSWDILARRFADLLESVAHGP